MTRATKWFGTALFCAALISLLFIAAGLSNLQLLPGDSTPIFEQGNTTLAVPETSTFLHTYSFTFLYGFLALAFLVLLVYVSARLLLFRNRKVILRATLAMGIILALMYLMPRIRFQQRTVPTGVLPDFVTNPGEITAPLPFGTPPPAIAWLVVGVVGLGLSLPLFQLLRRRTLQTKEVDPLLQEFENAAQAIQSGKMLKNVILRSYFKMAQILQVEQNLERDHTMTVREFERLVVAKGYPPLPIHQLTGLFEKVRYGAEAMSDRDEQIAANSLNEIITLSSARGSDQ